MNELLDSFCDCKEYSDGTRKWFWSGSGKLHRFGAPAIEYANGDRKWYFEGELHREDGPAAEFADGERIWYLWGLEMTQLEHFKMSPHFHSLSASERVLYRLTINE